MQNAYKINAHASILHLFCMYVVFEEPGAFILCFRTHAFCNYVVFLYLGTCYCICPLLECGARCVVNLLAPCMLFYVVYNELKL